MTSKPTRAYLVERPYLGVQIYMVKATSGADAAQRVKDGDPTVEEIDFRVTKSFEPRRGTVDR